MRLLSQIFILIAFFILTPCSAQETTVSQSWDGYLIQTAITPESYLITSSQELSEFTTMLPKVTPYKTLPATPSPDPLLNGATVNFEESVLVIATGRDRISDPPRFKAVETAADGTRLVVFELPERSSKTHPYGWAVYSAVVLPRTEGLTKVVVLGTEKADDEFQRADFKRADFPRL